MTDKFLPVEPQPQEPPPAEPVAEEEVVTEEVEPHETRETPIEHGYEAINRRIDDLESRIMKAIKPEKKIKEEQEKKEDASQTEEPKPKSRRFKLFR